MNWTAAILGWLFSLASMLIFVWLVCAVLITPLRRRRAAWQFLRIVEAALAQGKSIEHALATVRGAGWRFRLLSWWLGKGHRLVDALRKVPGIVPRQIVETLAAAERAGDIRLALPACRQIVADAGSRVRAAHNFFVVMATGSALTCPLIILLVFSPIIPGIGKLLTEMGAPSQAVHLLPGGWIFGAYLASGLFFLLCLFTYLLGPRLKALWPLRYLSDSIAVLLPWRSKRLHRDFSMMLSALLDAGVPEAEAVRLAASSTANWLLVVGGKRVARALDRGVPLPEAIRLFDRGGEFRWRLANAVHAKGGFLRALAGWHDSLEAKAEQQEQAAAQLITTALVLLNGALVGLFAVGLFGALVVMQEAILW